MSLAGPWGAALCQRVFATALLTLQNWQWVLVSSVSSRAVLVRLDTADSTGAALRKGMREHSDDCHDTVTLTCSL
jgi:hypothetical protein